MNKTESAKYGYSPEYIEKKSLSSEKFRIVFNFERIKKSKQISNRLNKYDKACIRARKRNLDIGENILLLDEKIKKKPAAGKF